MVEQKDSGLSQIQWCKIKGIPTNTFQYRCRKVRLTMEEKLQDAMINIAPDALVDHVRMILDVLANA